jgi:chlorophyll synthase
MVRAGAISETEVVVQFLALLGAGLGTAFALDKWAGHETPTLFYLAVFGSFISYIYSAPPLKLKQSGWAGNYALGSSYISLPWWAGQVRSITPAVLLAATGMDGLLTCFRVGAVDSGFMKAVDTC